MKLVLSKTIKHRLITIAVLFLLALLLSIIENFPNFIESWYSEGLYPVICNILHLLFNFIPFSVGDVFYIVLILSGLIAIVQLIRFLFIKKFEQFFSYLLKIVVTIQVLYLVFYLFWGLNYYRPSAAKRLGLQDTSYTINDIEAVTAKLIDSANLYRSYLTNSDLKVTNAVIYQNGAEAIAALSKQSVNYVSYRPKAKSAMLTWATNYLQTAGYYNPFTGESQVNYQMPVFMRPATTTHELSHQMGFGAEDEADFVGFLAGISSRNKLLKYSAYYLGVDEFMRSIRSRDNVNFKALKACISPAVLNDFKTERLYWQSFEGRTGTLSGIFYDHFLKANNQPHGLRTYNRMIRLTMAWYKKNEPAILQTH
ncbi:DUF3810 domain-containing protein [Mucilaginibacter sp. HMF5004]|uniref:DUF3810 domain-containing protein n=1 Tax=Mucilaginibacter rivuli TaxID=2857527 RepID=UPI001C5E7999|nr:DUF3810 domain-containing protein [Mucilaginibacter rivuli]MBW4889078.1 DUF3810 domain-containing protein [Mucilaginibacter rivuli]